MTCSACGIGSATPPPYIPRVISVSRPATLFGLGQTSSARDYTPDVVGGLAGFAVPFLYTRFRPKKWPKANLAGQLAMVGATYFGVRWAFTASQ